MGKHSLKKQCSVAQSISYVTATMRFGPLIPVFLIVATTCIGIEALSTPTAIALNPEPTQYTSFRNEEFKLYAWKGENIAFLTRSKDLDRRVMRRLCQTFDIVYEYFVHATGRKPRPLPRTAHQGRGTIAEVANTCGAGCGYLGAVGIELMPQAFRTLYQGVRDRDEYDQVLFYEFGRNFWFYENKIEYKGADRRQIISTGYAVFMRFMAAEVAGVAGGPFAGRPWSEFRAEVERMVEYYLEDADLNWSNTLRIGRAPANPMNLGATDLFAGFLMRLQNEHGGLGFVRRLWHEVGRRPNAATTQDAVDNLVIAASIAAGVDLSGQFTKWRWPVSDAAREEIGRRRREAREKGRLFIDFDHDSGNEKG